MALSAAVKHYGDTQENKILSDVLFFFFFFCFFCFFFVVVFVFVFFLGGGGKETRTHKQRIMKTYRTMDRKNDISVDAVRYEQNDTSGNHP